MTDTLSSAAAPVPTLFGMGAGALSWEGDRASVAKAFVAAQKAMEAVKKAATNPAFKTKYADLSEVVEAVVPALNNAGIGVIQNPAYDGDWVSLTTTFLHESGASVSSTLRLRPSKTDPQGIGSAVTYARRYSLLSMTGAAPEDDDGNASSGPRQHRQPEGPSAAAQFAADQLRVAKTKDEFTSFWNGQKAGLKETLSEADYAHVVKVMQTEAARFADKPAAENDTFPGDMTQEAA
jgi:ERF superfamily